MIRTTRITIVLLFLRRLKLLFVNIRNSHKKELEY